MKGSKVFKKKLSYPIASNIGSKVLIKKSKESISKHKSIDKFIQSFIICLSSDVSNVPVFLLPVEKITYLDISPLRKSPTNFFLLSSS